MTTSGAGSLPGEVEERESGGGVGHDRDGWWDNIADSSDEGETLWDNTEDNTVTGGTAEYITAGTGDHDQ